MKSPTHSLRSPLPPAVLAALLLMASVAPGCDKKAPPDAPAVAAASPSAAPTQAPSAAPGEPPPASSVEAPAVPLDGLIGRLALEARFRPKVQPTADEVLAVLDKLGETIPTRQQSLGDTYKANYCLGGYTLDGAFALSACEYADAPAASAGRDLSKKLLAHVTARDVWSHKADTLAIVQLKPDDATTAQKKKLVAAFLAM
jgi:hypothetical protein